MNKCIWGKCEFPNKQSCVETFQINDSNNITVRYCLHIIIYFPFMIRGLCLCTASEINFINEQILVGETGQHTKNDNSTNQCHSMPIALSPKCSCVCVCVCVCVYVCVRASTPVSHLARPVGGSLIITFSCLLIPSEVHNSFRKL